MSNDNQQSGVRNFDIPVTPDYTTRYLRYIADPDDNTYANTLSVRDKGVTPIYDPKDKNKIIGLKQNKGSDVQAQHLKQQQMLAVLEDRANAEAFNAFGFASPAELMEDISAKRSLNYMADKIMKSFPDSNFKKEDVLERLMQLSQAHPDLPPAIIGNIALNYVTTSEGFTPAMNDSFWQDDAGIPDSIHKIYARLGKATPNAEAPQWLDVYNRYATVQNIKNAENFYADQVANSDKAIESLKSSTMTKLLKHPDAFNKLSRFDQARFNDRIRRTVEKNEDAIDRYYKNSLAMEQQIRDLYPKTSAANSQEFLKDNSSKQDRLNTPENDFVTNALQDAGALNSNPLVPDRNLISSEQLRDARIASGQPITESNYLNTGANALDNFINAKSDYIDNVYRGAPDVVRNAAKADIPVWQDTRGNLHQKDGLGIMLSNPNILNASEAAVLNNAAQNFRNRTDQLNALNSLSTLTQ